MSPGIRRALLLLHQWTALYFLVSLGIAMQATTGVLIWWNARGRTSS